MIYAYDQWAQMPTKDIYDTLMMAMAINAAKDMYDKGEKQLADFKKEYGDFYSPSELHMNFYNLNFNVGGFVDQLRKRGIDPLRSQEGRTLVQLYINSRPYSSLQRMKKSAENYDEYLKNVAKAKSNGTFNQNFEDFILDGKNINNLGVNEMWDRTAPSTYMDLNQYTGHLFDKMKDEYMYTDKNGRDWYGVNADRRRQALTPMMGDLLSTDLGQFHLRLAEVNAALRLGRTPTKKEVMLQFADDVITSTKEYDYRDWKENPEYKRKQEWELAKKKEALAHYYRTKEQESKDKNNKRSNKDQEVTSYGQTLLNRGISKWAGSSDPGVKGLQRAQQFGTSVGNLPYSQRQGAFLNFYSMNDAESPTAWVSRFSEDSSRTKDAPVGGVNYVPTYDLNKLFSSLEMTTRTINYPGGSIRQSKKEIPTNAAMIPTGRVYTAPMRDGTYSQFIEVNVGDADNNQKLWYKVTETEPVNVVEPSILQQKVYDPNILSDNVIAPAGYSTIPSQETVNQWSIQDRGLNKAIGLGSDEYKQATGYFLDNIQ